jgi:hypothetical protein
VEKNVSWKNKPYIFVKSVYIYILDKIYLFVSVYTVRKNRKHIIDYGILKELFNGKKIAIVGPADTAYKYKNGSLIDSCDLVVRFNNNYLLVDPEDVEKTSRIGSKTDIIFHIFKYNKDNTAVLDVDRLNKQGLMKIISILHDKKTRLIGQRGHRGLRVFMKNNRKFLADKLYLIPENYYKKIYNDLGSKPTVGHIAITTILECVPASVFITGFSYFTTPYAQGYREYTTIEKQLERFEENIHGHDPANELRYFSELLKKTTVKVEVDPYLKELIEKQ